MTGKQRGKRSPWWLAEALRLNADGRSTREIAEIVGQRAQKGQKKPSHTSVHGWLKEAKGGGTTAGGGLAPPSRPPSSEPEPADEPVDESEMTPQEFARWLTGQLRAQQTAAKRFTAAADLVSAQRATRIATSLAGLLAKVQARDDDGGDMVKIRQSEIDAAAERARSKVHDLVARLAAERGR